MKKRLNRTLILTTAVLTLGAAAAYGQYPLTAKVPFSFNIKGAELPAGDYTIAKMYGGPVLQLRDSVSGKAVMAMTQNSSIERTPGGARLVFRCGDLSGCSLAKVWTDSGNGWEFATPRIAPDEKERLAVVFLNRPVGQ